MGKTYKCLFGISTTIIAIVAAIFLIFVYWEKILAYTTAGARVASNILGQFTSDSDDEDDSAEYYDI